MTTDFVIVGAGSAGCVLANRLSADPSVRVVLIEAGIRATQKEASIPVAWPKLFKSSCDWAYETEPEPGLAGRRLFVPRGRALGGTSSINAMVYQRGHRADFDAWASLGNAGWSYEEVLPYFKRSEDNARGASRYHGAGGPLLVNDLQGINPLSRAFAEAAAHAGIPRNDDANGATQDGVAITQVTIRRGKRWSAADAFLYPAMKRPNLTVITDAHVTGIGFDGRRASRISYVREGRAEVVHVGDEVILCAGSFNSPQLLMLSGIGPAGHLRAHGIDVVQDLPGVGRHLQEHAVAGLRVRALRPSSLLSAESIGNLAKYILFRRGMLASNGPEAVAFVRSRPELSAPDLELVLIPILWLDQGLTLPTEHGFTVVAILLTPRSRGEVALRSADPFQPPVIRMNLFSDSGGHDLRTLVAGLRLLRSIVSQAPLADISGDELYPGPATTSDDDLARAVAVEGQTVWHPVGTCRMGNDPDSVVDATLRVHGIEGLRVVDASIMPTITRGHTHAPTVMIAERASDLLLGRAIS